MADNRPCGIQDAEHNAILADAYAAEIHLLSCECNKEFRFYNTKRMEHHNIWAGEGQDKVAVCSRHCKHIYENGSDRDYDDLYMETNSLFNDRHNNYILAWNYYVGSCKRSKEEIYIKFSDYKRMVPESQVNEMIEVYNLS